MSGLQHGSGPLRGNPLRGDTLRSEALRPVDLSFGLSEQEALGVALLGLLACWAAVRALQWWQNRNRPPPD